MVFAVVGVVVTGGLITVRLTLPFFVVPGLIVVGVVDFVGSAASRVLEIRDVRLLVAHLLLLLRRRIGAGRSSPSAVAKALLMLTDFALVGCRTPTSRNGADFPLPPPPAFAAALACLFFLALPMTTSFWSFGVTFTPCRGRGGVDHGRHVGVVHELLEPSFAPRAVALAAWAQPHLCGGQPGGIGKGGFGASPE